jgi:PAS domain S-box-containing protein
MERISGVPEEEAIGRPYHQVYPAKRAGRLLTQAQRFITQAIKRGETVLSEGVDVDLVCRDGREIPVSITAAPIVEDGRVVGGVGVVRELPERART